MCTLDRTVLRREKKDRSDYDETRDLNPLVVSVDKVGEAPRASGYQDC